jgi:predicted kinase
MELVIFIGLQGAGKTSFYRSHFASTHVLVSKDRLRNNRRPGRRQRQLIDEALDAGQSVVVDNRATVVGYYFESRLEDCLERNRLRTGKERVPDVALLTVAKKLETPAFAEGFDRLFYVRLVADRKFTMQEWADGPNQDATL